MLFLSQGIFWFSMLCLYAGTLWTATAHIAAAVVGSGVLALAWTVAQLGWVMGPLVILGFFWVTYYTSTLLADCYRFPDPITGTPNRVYIDAVRCYLGLFFYNLLEFLQKCYLSKLFFNNIHTFKIYTHFKCPYDFLFKFNF